jgi:hypothetical protein
MSKWEDLNIKLRIQVLTNSLRLEQSASNILKAILRILKQKTKTLDNKSSSLSFKNKVDLMHDLNELSKEEYDNLIKFMEIRNQLIHNHECTSFLKLSETNPELSNFLKKKFPNSEPDQEISLNKSYNELYVVCQGGLLVLEKEYVAGLKIDFEKYVALQVEKRFDELIERTKHNMKSASYRISILSPFLYDYPDNHINDFILALKIEKSKMASEILDDLDKEDNMIKAFRNKVTIDELIKELETREDK